MSNYHRKIKIPIRVIESKDKDMEKREILRKETKRGISKQILKIIYCSVLIFSLIISQSLLSMAFESHIINVTAHICDYSETRTMGYWKNHPNVYLPHLPQTLGAPGEDEIIDTQQEVTQVFLNYNLSMRNKLRGQLLAMKFNIAYFGIGGFIPDGDTRTLDQIVTDADNLLRQDPPPPDSVLETMKNLLDDTNNLHQIRYCSTAGNTGTESEPIIDVVINEFLPNPIGRDNASMPDGEWVELYNRGNEIDVANWVLYDSDDNHELFITPANTNTGSTIIGTGEFLVAYRDGDGDFALNNVGGDTVRLYNGDISSGGTLIDSHTYTIDALEGKSFARIPDGSDNWVDPVPTPGEPNVLGNEDVVFGPALSEPDEEISEENTEPQEEQLTVEESVVEPIEETSLESETQQLPTTGGGGGSETQPPTDGVDPESQVEEEEPAIDEEPVIDETPATEPTEEMPPVETSASGSTEDNQADNPIEEETNQNPATTPEEVSGELPSESSGNSSESSTGESSDSNSSNTTGEASEI